MSEGEKNLQPDFRFHCIKASPVSSHCAVGGRLYWKLLDRFLERLFSSFCSLRSRSCLTCNTLRIASFKPVCCEPRPSTTHVTNESLRSGLAAEKLFQIWQAHFRSAHRKWMACWWKDDNPICGGDIDTTWEKNICRGILVALWLKVPYHLSQLLTMSDAWMHYFLTTFFTEPRKVKARFFSSELLLHYKVFLYNKSQIQLEKHNIKQQKFRKKTYQIF